MGRSKKKSSAGSGEFSLFDDADSPATDSDEDLPRDEAGRAKIKRQYVDLLGIRVRKLAGRILNRERINKTLEGIYFVCVSCRTVCHNLDEGLIEDSDNKANICTPCSRRPPAAPEKRAASAPKRKSVSRAKTATSKASKASKSGASRTTTSRSTTAKSSASKASSSKSASSKSGTSSQSTRKTTARKRR